MSEKVRWFKATSGGSMINFGDVIGVVGEVKLSSSAWKEVADSSGTPIAAVRGDREFVVGGLAECVEYFSTKVGGETVADTLRRLGRIEDFKDGEWPSWLNKVASYLDKLTACPAAPPAEFLMGEIG